MTGGIGILIDVLLNVVKRRRGEAAVPKRR